MKKMKKQTFKKSLTKNAAQVSQKLASITFIALMLGSIFAGVASAVDTNNANESKSLNIIDRIISIIKSIFSGAESDATKVNTTDKDSESTLSVEPTLIWKKTFDSEVTSANIGVASIDKSFFPLKTVVTRDKIIFFDEKGDIKKQKILKSYESTSVSGNGEFIGILTSAPDDHIVTVMNKEGQIEVQYQVEPYDRFLIANDGSTVVFGDRPEHFVAFTHLAFYDSSGNLINHIIGRDFTSSSCLKIAEDANLLVLNVRNREDGISHLILYTTDGKVLWDRVLDDGTPSDVAISQKGEFIVTSNYPDYNVPNYVYFFDNSGTLLGKYSGEKGTEYYYKKIVLSPSAGKYTVAISKNILYFFDTKSGSLLWKKENDLYPKGYYTSCDLSSDGNHIVTSFRTDRDDIYGTRYVYLFDKSGRQIWKHKFDPPENSFDKPDVQIDEGGECITIVTDKNFCAYKIKV